MIPVEPTPPAVQEEIIIDVTKIFKKGAKKEMSIHQERKDKFEVSLTERSCYKTNHKVTALKNFKDMVIASSDDGKLLRLDSNLKEIA